MAKTFSLEILTPTGRYFEGEVEYLNVRSEDYSIGVLPGHTPLISTLTICHMQIKKDGLLLKYAISGGVIKIDKDKTVLLLDAVEKDEEIDTNRAKESLRRAKERLDTNDAEIDKKRAELAYKRAINRLLLLSDNIDL